MLFFDDYSADKVGDFPRRMEFLQGNWDVVEWQGRRLLRNTGPRYATLKIILPRELPERLTMEFDAHFSLSNDQMVISTAQPEGNWTTIEGNFFRLGIGHGTGVDSRQPAGGTSVNSATIRPESTPTLDEIGTMMEEHPDLRLRIEGHTDSTGDDASNLALSERRAEAVRDFLAASYGIDASRMEIQGLGETQPIDDNETPEGRQNNRRVELVNLDGVVSG